MKNLQILKFILNDPSFQKIRTNLNNGLKSVRISEKISTRSLLVGALSFIKPVVVVAKNKTEVIQFAHVLNKLNLNLDILENKNKNFLKILDDFNHKSTPFKIIITTIEVLIDKIIKPESFQKQILIFEKNQKIKLSEMINRLQQSHYQLQNKVIIPGEYSLRGSVLDVFPEHFQKPVRIEFVDDMIEQIFEYDLYSGQKDKNLNLINIIPKNSNQLDGRVSDWFLKDSLIIFNESQDIISQIKNLEVIGEIDSIENFKKTIQAKILNLDFFVHNMKSKNFEVLSFEKFAGKINIFRQKIIDFNKLNFKTFLMYPINLKIKKTLKQNRIHSIELIKSEFDEGFYLPNSKIAFFSAKDIFGSIIKSIYRKAKFKERKFIESLKPYDLLVHLDHGIGRFLKIDYLPKDLMPNSKFAQIKYLYLEYRDYDKLYIPEFQVSKLTKYIGISGKTAILSRIGTASWERILTKAKENAKSIALELLSIYSLRRVKKGFRFLANLEWEKLLENTFEFEETPDQTKAIMAVFRDMGKDTPTDRLIAGDVGFGKTEVAIRAALRAVASGKQAAVLAPTTILAEQHLATFQRRLKEFPVKIESLSRFKDKKTQEKIISELINGQIDIVIGTHRLLQQDINFANLGLVIIDEEQRFGVSDKEKLKRFRIEVDVLTLSATPIPRTLQQAMAGIKKISFIETPPQNRRPIKIALSNYNYKLIKAYLKNELSRNGQIYYLLPRVKNIEAKVAFLQRLLGQKVKIITAHGQMREDLLAKAMLEFTAGKADILVCTKIIENGLDLPSVNTIIVEEAHRFGLAELYQLKGRVGRGNVQGYGLFLVPDRENLNLVARKRLTAFLEAQDLGSGLQIAQKDLEIRGAGNILGQEQSGHMVAVGLTLYSQLLHEEITKLKAGIKN